MGARTRVGALTIGRRSQVLQRATVVPVGVQAKLAPRKVFVGKAEEWKEWKDDMEEYWEIHDPGAKAALHELVETGNES